MYRKAHPLFLFCQTPAHVGSGSELGTVDLPIQREKHTGYPKFEASSLKGSIREAFEKKVGNKAFNAAADPDVTIHRLFGYDEGSLKDPEKGRLKKHFQKKKGKDAKGDDVFEDQNSFAGALGFTDARLLLFPVKSMKGVFAWITCFRVLKQFLADMKLTDPDFDIEGLNEAFLQTGDTYLFSADSSLKFNKDRIVLEEYTFKIDNELNGVVQVRQNGAKTDFPDWLAENLFKNDGSYWSEKIKKDIVVLPDNDFTDFVKLSTEVITRTKIDNETGTVAQGALFTEEYLPSETLMYALILTAAEFREKTDDPAGVKPMAEPEVFNFFSQHLPEYFQIGANATLGKGIVKTRLTQGGRHE